MHGQMVRLLLVRQDLSAKTIHHLSTFLRHPLKVTTNQYQSRMTCCSMCSSTSSDFSNISLSTVRSSLNDNRSSKTNTKTTDSCDHTMLNTSGILLLAHLSSGWNLVQLFLQSSSFTFCTKRDECSWQIKRTLLSRHDPIALSCISNKGAMIHRKETRPGQITSAGRKKKTLEYVYVREK